MALPPGSIAVDRIPAPCGTTPDQRGVTRPQGTGCDAGAYELAPPDLLSVAASKLTTRTVLITGQIVPNARVTTWHIDDGRTPAYGSATTDQTLAAGTTAVPVSATLSGLAPHTTYHYRIVTSNADGTTTGTDGTFTTASFAGVTTARGALTATASGRVRVTVACPSRASGPCTGLLALTTRVQSGSVRHPKLTTLTLGQAHFSCAAGTRRTITVVLSTRARALLRAAGRRGLAITLRASARDANGVSATTTAATTLAR